MKKRGGSKPPFRSNKDLEETESDYRGVSRTGEKR
jgi:hypothetical protein